VVDQRARGGEGQTLFLAPGGGEVLNANAVFQDGLDSADSVKRHGNRSAKMRYI
jgi:hypothetical protein